MNAAARRLVADLQLAPLPGEGGFFRATWRNASASAILFLLTPDDFSAFHRLEQDEVWHFHAGDAVEHARLDARLGTVGITRLGADLSAGDSPQVVAPAGVWQGARLAPGGRLGYAVLGCTVAPPWDERGFQLADRAALLAAFPGHAGLVQALTR